MMPSYFPIFFRKRKTLRPSQWFSTLEWVNTETDILKTLNDWKVEKKISYAIKSEMNIHSRNFWCLSCIVLKNSCFSLVNNIYTQDKYQLLNQINDLKTTQRL